MTAGAGNRTRTYGSQASTLNLWTIPDSSVKSPPYQKLQIIINGHVHKMDKLVSALMALYVRIIHFSIYVKGFLSPFYDTLQILINTYPSPGLNHAVKVKLLTLSSPLELSILPHDSKDGLKR